MRTTAVHHQRDEHQDVGIGWRIQTGMRQTSGGEAQLQHPGDPVNG